jgi:chemotaxis protein histidine kinase CheA
MELDPKILRQLLQIFSNELGAQTQVMVDGLIRLEKGTEPEGRQLIFDEIFRAAHNIKGAAQGVGVSAVGNIAHHLESLFSHYKQVNAAPSPDMIDLCLECVDCMPEILKSHINETPLGIDIDEVIGRLESFCLSSGDGPAAKPVTDTAASGKEAAGKKTVKKKTVKKKTVKKKTAKKKTVTGKNAELVDDGESAVSSHPYTKPEQAGINTSPTEHEKRTAVQVVNQPGNDAEIISISVDKIESVDAFGEELQVAKIEMDDHLKAVQEFNGYLDSFTNMWANNMPVWKHNSIPDEVSQFLSRSTDSVAELNNLSKRVFKGMRSSIKRLGILSNHMQNDIRMMRLVPVSSLLQPLARNVRDIARDLGKQVDYKTVDNNIEIDRAVLDGIRDPLVHLLRNAIDHGLEMPGQRRSAGKPETGQIIVRVMAVGSRIHMIVEDDGKGIEVETIADVASKRNIISEADISSLNDNEILDLIFRPGFSSKEIVTNVSGRGVGLDVVRNNLRKLKGNVHVDTTPGKGTVFTLDLPLTLSTEHGLMLRCANNLYSIPTTSVDRVMEINPDMIVDVEASETILVDERAVPLRSLASILELRDRNLASMERMPVILVSKGWDMVAFAVDEIIGEREIVIKPFQPPLISVRNVTGGTLTGSGDIVIVLNPSDLVESALKAGSIRLTPSPDETVEDTSKTTRILVVDDSITTRTLEKNILQGAGYQVLTAVDGVQAWEILQAEPVDLVVTDIQMPNMDGFDLTDHIKQSEELKNLPVIIVTSLASDDDQKRGIEVGASAYIVKGEFETRVLLETVQQMV